jgi:putative ABC transport system permease protein
MRRLAWSQLRFGTVRVVALLIGMLLATTAFTVLTAASRTSQLRTVGTVAGHSVPAYQVLVRPAGTRTPLEAEDGVVQPSFLSGVNGGITMAQYQQIARLSGVSVAAPVALVGYTQLVSVLTRPLPAASYAAPGRQLYRISTTWVSDGGSSRIAQPSSYTYVTPDPLQVGDSDGSSSEQAPGHPAATVCPAVPAVLGGDPFGPARQAEADCYSKANGYGGGQGGAPGGNPGYAAVWVLPVLIAAVDPVAEAKLDGLDHAVTAGRYLAENARASNVTGDSAQSTADFPVLASTTSGMTEYARTQVDQLAAPATPPDMTAGWMQGQARAPGTAVATTTTSAQQAYQALLAAMRPGNKVSEGIFSLWSVGPVSYQPAGGSAGALTPRVVSNPSSVWSTSGLGPVSMDNADRQFRAITDHTHGSTAFAAGTGGLVASPKLVGTFNPAKVTAFDPLSAVPLSIYQATAAGPADAASAAALGGTALRPNENLGGYVSQPVNLITTLSALPALYASGRYGQALPSADPISTIRVRVAGVTGDDSLSLARIRQVAQQIEQQTRLDVDIVAGTSPAATAVDLPAGRFGRPPLALTEEWVKKGVAVAILSAVDRSSVLLFCLILVVCVLFVANSASAAVRGRRRELGILACLGWTRPRLFGAVLGELAAIGLAAGLLGGAAAVPLSAALGLRASPGRAALAVPVAMAVAVVAGVVPAWRAARGEPANSVRPAVLSVRRARHPGGVTALAAVNVLRTPGRALAGAASLAVGVAALTVLAAVSLAFHGALVGTLLGDAVSVQDRGVDYAAAGATVALGVLAVADVVFLGIRERAAELTVIRTFGWRESALTRMVVTEGALIGLAGSLAGAALGLAAAFYLAGQQPPGLYAVALAAVAGGTVLTVAAAVAPAQALRRLPAATLLTEE